MVDPIPEEDRELEEAIREALSDLSPPPRDLCAKVRLAVHAEAVREPVRARRSFRLCAGLTFAFACMIGFLIRSSVTNNLPWRRSSDLSFAAIAQQFRTEEPSAHADDRHVLDPPQDESGTNRSSDPSDKRPWQNPSIEASRQVPRSLPRFVSFSRDSSGSQRSRVVGHDQGIWKHERWSILDVPVDLDAIREPSSSIRISVTDPIEGVERSMQLAREFRDGEIHSKVEYETTPVAASGGE